MAALNPHPLTPITLDKERDYPRRYLTEYKVKHPDEEAIAITTTWELEAKDIARVEAEFGKDVLKENTVTILRRYEGTDAEWTVATDFPKAVDNLLAAGGFEDAQIAGLRAVKSVGDLAEKIASVPETPKQKALLERVKGFKSVRQRVIDLLKPALPKFMYFAAYDRMAGMVQVEALKQLQANEQIDKDEHSSERLFLEFLEYAGVPIDEILAVKTYETFNARLQGASNNITDQMLEYWTQNPELSVEVDIRQAHPGDPAPFNTGTIGRARIYNDLHRVDTPFSERSAGFVWFFSFLVKFARVKSLGHPVLLLLDEPGLTLHGKAQGDLLRYFDEKLAPHHQIIYSTHSPFMVAADKLLSSRIVEDKVEQRGPRRISIGTKVREDVLTTDSDTLFPLQGAIGYEITQTLFVGKHTLLVEGASDIVYLQALSYELKRRKRTGLDTRWTMCPSGGIGNVRAFVSLFGGNKLDVAALVDYTKKDEKKIEELRKSDILKTGRVFTVAQFTGKSESDIEDIFEPDLFVQIVNATYELTGEHVLTRENLEKADENTMRLVKKAEAAFNLLPESMPLYDHFTPSAWLLQNANVLQGDSGDVKTTLDRAETLFLALNAALEKA